MTASTLFTLIPPLVVIIIAIALVIYKRKHPYQARRVHREPRFNSTTQRALDDFQRDQQEQIDTEDELVEDYEEISPEEQENITESIAHNQPEINKNSQSLNAEINDLIVIGLKANEDHPYAGYELLQALLSSGLRYGKMSIFHRHEEANGKGAILFSLASAIEPGTFDLPKMGAFITPGLTMFMRISSLSQPAQTFELMLDTAQQLIEDLGGELCDETRQPLTEEKIKEWREQVSQFEQSQQTSDLFS